MHKTENVDIFNAVKELDRKIFGPEQTADNYRIIELRAIIDKLHAKIDHQATEILNLKQLIKD